MAFDPDAFLATPNQDMNPAVAFDPDAFLAQSETTEPPPSDIINTAQQPAQDEDGFFGASVIEPAAAMVSGVGSTIAGGLLGSLQTLNPFTDEGAAAQLVKDIQTGGTYQPRTTAGKEGLQVLGEIAQTVAQGINKIPAGYAGLYKLATAQGVDQAVKIIDEIQQQGAGEVGAEKTFEETGSPLAATSALIGPDAVLSALGFTPAIAVARTIPATAKSTGVIAKDVGKGLVKYQSPAKREIAKKIIEGEADISTAGYQLKQPPPAKTTAIEKPADDVKALPPPSDAKTTAKTEQPAGKIETFFDTKGAKVRKDKAARVAMRQGVTPGVVASTAGASAVDRAAMREMVTVAQKSKRNELYAMDNRPIDVVGKTFADMTRKVFDVNKQAGKRMDSVAETLKGNQVNIDDALASFLVSLKKQGIKVNKKNLTLDYSKADMQGFPKAQALIDRVYKRLVTYPNKNAYDVHKFKKFIDAQVKYGKSADGFTGDAERTLKSLRFNFNEILRDKFPEYKSVNDQYAKSINVLKELQRLAGSRVDLKSSEANRALGSMARSIMSNNKSVPQVLKVMGQIESVAKRYGKKINTDIKRQALFADEIDRLSGPAGRTSFQGQIRQAGEAVMDQVGKTLTGVALDLGKAGVKKAMRQNEDNTLKALKGLVTDKKI